MKRRLDILLVERGLASGRDRAKALIMEGLVYVDGEKSVKPGEEVEEGRVVEVRGVGLRYVSRGGLKLEKAVERFPLRINGAVCADIGASTGGFTDCMLQNGAAKVYAVDVGYGQLAWTLRSDPRVITLERQNARHLTGELIPEQLGLVTVDVSFISLRLLLPVLKDLLQEDGQMVCLIKPQFEAGRDKVGKKGVVRDLDAHREVIMGICAFAAEIGLIPSGLDYSPIKGPQGNIEYLLYLERGLPCSWSDGGVVDSVARAAHESLGG